MTTKGCMLLPAIVAALGICLTVLIYMLLTIFRDIRDNFTVEIWQALGYGDTPHILATAEIPVAVGVLIIMLTIQQYSCVEQPIFLDFSEFGALF